MANVSRVTGNAVLCGSFCFQLQICTKKAAKGQAFDKQNFFYFNFWGKFHVFAGSLEAAYSLNWGAQKIWGKGGGETLALL